MKYRTQEPEVGSWFVNRSGTLMKVKLIMYRHEEILKVMIEFIEGKIKIVSIDDWNYLELSRQISLRSQANA